MRRYGTVDVPVLVIVALVALVGALGYFMLSPASRLPGLGWLRRWFLLDEADRAAGEDELLRSLRETLSTHRSLDVAARQLAGSGDRSLERLVGDRNPQIRYVAARALRHSGLGTTPALISQLRGELWSQVRRAILAALAARARGGGIPAEELHSLHTGIRAFVAHGGRRSSWCMRS